ncbi:MAG: hypothetical protein AABW68_03060, partial [archaeon]
AKLINEKKGNLVALQFLGTDRKFLSGIRYGTIESRGNTYVLHYDGHPFPFGSGEAISIQSEGKKYFIVPTVLYTPAEK